MTIKITAIPLLILILTGCDSDESIYGRWKNKDTNCQGLCSFSIKKQDNDYSDSVIIFFNAESTYIKSKPIVRDDKHKNRYLAKGENGDFLFELYKNRLYGADNSIYEKIHNE